jgi:dethiobiotin synthetase
VPAAYSDVNPYCFEPSISPHIAAEDARIEVDIGTIRSAIGRLSARADWVVIEGAGGWLAPIGPALSMADLARALGAPVLLVVGLRLGCLNHARLTRLAIEASGAPFAGWIGCGVDAGFARGRENLASLAQFLHEEPLAIVPYAPQRAADLALEADVARRLEERLTKHRAR